MHPPVSFCKICKGPIYKHELVTVDEFLAGVVISQHKDDPEFGYAVTFNGVYAHLRHNGVSEVYREFLDHNLSS